MKRLIFLTTAFVFLLCGIAQAEPLVFDVTQDSVFFPPEYTEPLPINVSVDTSIHGLKVWSDPIFPIGNYNFKLEIEGVEAGHFTSVDGLSVEEEVIDYDNNTITLEFISDLPGPISIGNVRKRPTDSFYVLFDVHQAGVGTSAYSLHWQSNESESIFFSRFDDPQVDPSNPNRLLVSFGLSLPTEFVPGTRLFTTEFSGDFTPVTEPSAIPCFAVNKMKVVDTLRGTKRDKVVIKGSLKLDETQTFDPNAHPVFVTLLGDGGESLFLEDEPVEAFTEIYDEGYGDGYEYEEDLEDGGKIKLKLFLDSCFWKLIIKGRDTSSFYEDDGAAIELSIGGQIGQYSFSEWNRRIARNQKTVTIFKSEYPVDCCSCVPLTCTDQELECGEHNDTCGGTLDCGSCPPEQFCINGSCLGY